MVGKRGCRERPFGFGLRPETGGRRFHILRVVNIAPAQRGHARDLSARRLTR